MTLMTDTDPQQVAILGLPHLAQALTDAGLQVVTADSFRAAASAANAKLKVAPLPMVMADVAVPGTSPWVEKVVRACPVVFVAVDLEDGQKRVAGNTQGAQRLSAPVGVDDILASVGIPALGTGQVLTEDGSLTAAQAPAPGAAPTDPGPDDDLDTFGDPDPQAPAEEPAAPAGTDPAPPVAPEPTSEPTPPPAPVLDFWGEASTPVVPVPATPATPTADLWQDEPTVAPPTPGPATTEPVDPAPWAPPPAAQHSPDAATTEQTHTEPEPVTPATPTPATVAGRIGVEAGYSPALGRRLAPVVFATAGKGGVGKTSVALALAQRAAVVGQLRTVLVDGNRGQGDLRTYLSLTKAGLPTVYDAVTTSDPSAAIVTPDRLNAHRPDGAEELAIALVQAPPRGLADPSTITSGIYHDVISAARAVADLVVVDTQIVEEAERGMFDDLIIPMLAAHAYAVGIADLSRPGVDNLITHLRSFTGSGVPTDRLMTMLNRVPQTTEFDLQRTSDALSRYGTFLAAVPADPQVHSAMAYGTSIQDNPALAPVLDKVLLKVTGNPVFAQVRATDHDPAPKRRGLFRRGRG